MSIDQYLTTCGSGKGNICFNCSLPIWKCPWLHEDKPVPGWTAERSRLNLGTDKHGHRVIKDTYHIIACPLQIPYPAERHKQDNTDCKSWIRTFYK